MQKIPERDWKRMRKMEKELLNMACERILLKVDKILKERKGKEHEAYLELFRLLDEEDKDIAIMFDDLRRSNALVKLVAWKNNGLFTDEQFTEFSEETQEFVERALS